jgi:hypothetical protein
VPSRYTKKSPGVLYEYGLGCQGCLLVNVLYVVGLGFYRLVDHEVLK